MAGMVGCFKSRNSDSAAMASGPPDVMTNQEPAEPAEECSGKKKSKFQTFKKFFARKKRKEPPAAGADAGLKASQSSDNVSKTSENNTLTRSEKDKGSGSKISLGSKALSHDSVFVSDSSEANEALGASQDSIHGKVKSLQLQLKQAIRLGSPPSLMCVKKMEDAGTMSEDDGLPCSPPEYTTLHTVMNQAQRNSSISLEGMDSDDDQLSCAASSRAVSPLVVPGDFSQPASPFGCLDNSAAKHKLGLRHKACNRRKPVSRLEVKAEGDSVVEETPNTSITEAYVEREQHKTTEVVSPDELKLKVEREEEEEEEVKEEEVEVEVEEAQCSRQSLLSDKEERDEAEDQSEPEQDVCASPPSELCLLGEEVPDSQPQPSSQPSSRASSLDSPRATPEPPAAPREYLMDPPGIAYGVEENGVRSDQETREEESSFLQEVLSSLKTPLASHSLGAEPQGVVLEIEEEVKEKEREDVQIEEGEEAQEEEEVEVEEPVAHQAAPAGSILSEEEEEEEEEEVVSLGMRAPSCEDAEEEEKVEDEEEQASEEEELVVEQFSHYSQEEEGEGEEEAEEVKPEDRNDALTGNAVNQAEEERRRGGEEEEGESEGEEEAIELENEPEVEEEEEEEEGWEKREEDDGQVEGKGRVEEAEEATEEERDEADEMTEVFADAEAEGVQIAEAPQGADEGADVVVGDEALYSPQRADSDETSTETGHQDLAADCEDGEDGEERVEGGVELESTEQKSDQEEDGEANQPAADQTEEDVEQEGVEVSHLDTEEVGEEQTESTEQARVSSKPSSLSLPEPQHETQPQDSGAVTPSKSGTTTLHINLISPSSEKVVSFFQQSPPAAYPEESETPSLAAAPAEQNTAPAEEEAPESVENAEEEESAPEEDATPAASAEETSNRPSSGSDQSKVRFTIAPAWQRSLSVEDAKESLTSPPPPPACVSSSPSAATGPGGVEVEASTKKDPEVKPEPASSAKVELVLSPGRVKNTGTTAAKPQTTPPTSPVKPQTAAAATTEESSVVVEGNPDNPFGVRLRKTAVLHRFSSEEETTEPPSEPPAQPTSCKVDSPQPISAKPSISHPVSNKPALPKKPDVHGDSGGKNKRISDAAATCGVSVGSDSPSWISMAKQKQKIYKENSLEEITVRKEEQERKSSLPMYVSSAASREQGNKTESTGKVSPLEISKPPVSAEKEARRALSPPTPVPFQPPKSQSLPGPVLPKPHVPLATAKHPPQPNPAQRSLSPPTPVPVSQKSPSCTSPLPPSKTATLSKTPQPQSTTLTSPPFSSRATAEKSASRAPGISSPTPSSQRGPAPPALPQDEPPWMALAKKKAKAWSEMPQIVQ